MRKRTTKSNHKKTHRKHRGGTRRKMPAMGNPGKSHIVKVFLECLNMIKLYHWKTHSYSQHKATDELYSKLNEHIDRFVEVLLGKDESRIKMMEKRIDLVDPKNTKDFKSRIYEYRTFLTDFDIHFDSKKDSDLLNIRDEILSDINQFLYLMTFDK